MTAAIVHSFVPAGEDGGIGGFDWGFSGMPAEDEVRADYALQTDTTHHDYTPSHIHRLVLVYIPEGLGGDDVTEYIEEHYLDAIEGGTFDGQASTVAMHNPNTEGATP